MRKREVPSKGSAISSLMLLTRDQFGYHTDFRMYAKYVSTYLKVKVVCLDKNLEKITLPAVDIQYVTGRNRVSRWWNLIREARKKSQKHDTVLVKYFMGCSVIAIFLPRKNLVLDIRTFSVDISGAKRFLSDTLLKLEALAFKRINIVSDELARKLILSKPRVVSLGTEIVRRAQQDMEFRNSNQVILLYVGTFHNRNLEDLIIGLSLFQSQHPHNPFILRLVGNGYQNELEELQRLVENLGLSNRVSFLGYLSGPKLDSEFQNSDVGLVHIPKKPYFSCQPSTKLFEYWGRGLPVLATDYQMTKNIVTHGAGILYDPSPEGFVSALEELISPGRKFLASEINVSASNAEWSRIIRSQFLPSIGFLDSTSDR
ncbi:MAG: glycosyltransferase [Micrococcales bacterium]|nr:glycosyltransferase [Micrococcales bacterium]